ncbi:MAG: RNA methyltransferase [Methylovirgula sp.]|uniref:class I SAM-dependent RNA methyltransferase n=1 Tax=Methylovirgula sp. TaxID=1978224 RepID=UPI00307650DD
MQELYVERLGQRGEGIARAPDGPVYVPYALAGETILAEVSGERGKLIEILAPSPARIDAFCQYYGVCGGCAVQTLTPDAYADWKRNLLVDALRHAGLTPPVDPLIDAHGVGRRRATFHARYESAGRPKVGFMQARAHEIVTIEACPILAPSLQPAPQIAQKIARALGAAGKPLDILITSTLSGPDVDIRGHGALSPAEMQALVRAAVADDLARISNHGVRVIERRVPLLRIGRADVALPPGGFLQATQAGEEALAAKVCAALKGARRIGDLFAGLGTFSLRLAEQARVHAVDSEPAALDALSKAARSTPSLQPVTIETRDLFQRPLAADDLAGFDAVVFDPPRAGAEAQARALAASKVPLVVAVSCNVQSFARDAALLTSGGYQFESVTPFDQFRYSPHVEIVGVFRRPAVRGRTRRLLG